MPNNAPKAADALGDSFSVVLPDPPAAVPLVGSCAIRANSLLRDECNANTILHLPNDTISLVWARGIRDGLTKCLAIDMHLLREGTDSHSSLLAAGIQPFESGRTH